MHSLNVTITSVTAGEKRGPSMMISTAAHTHAQRILKETWQYLRTSSLSKRENNQEALERVPKEMSLHLMCIYAAI